MTQISLSGRVVTAVATSLGQIRYAHAGDTIWSIPTNLTTNPPLSTTALNFADSNGGILWFVDGTNYRYFDPGLATVGAWVASAGTLPIVSGSIPRLIQTWRGRTVLAGLTGNGPVSGDPYDWFMSAIGNPTDFDYAPANPSPAQAVSGGTGPQGKVPDVITGFCPYTDDLAYLGCSSSLYLFQGDPMAGGQISLVTDRIGWAWGRAWCKDPYGTLYFFSNRCGIYSIAPGQQPQRMSQQIDQQLESINTGENSVSMIWDDHQQGVHIFVTEVANVAATTHFFYEWRSGSWWKDSFSNPYHNPLCCCQFDGNTPEDRVVLIGSWDGVVRYLDPASETDDTRIITSSVLIGPILTPSNDEMILKELQIILGDTSGQVKYSILAGRTPEQALANPVVRSGLLSGGRNPTQEIRWAGRAIYIRLDSIVPWRAEDLRMIFRTNGLPRRRQYR